jgi:hypothetical protein
MLDNLPFDIGYTLIVVPLAGVWSPQRPGMDTNLAGCRLLEFERAGVARKCRETAVAAGRKKGAASGAFDTAAILRAA